MVPAYAEDEEAALSVRSLGPFVRLTTPELTLTPPDRLPQMAHNISESLGPARQAILLIRRLLPLGLSPPCPLVPHEGESDARRFGASLFRGELWTPPALPSGFLYTKL